jgi:hypothetical protein
MDRVLLSQARSLVDLNWLQGGRQADNHCLDYKFDLSLGIIGGIEKICIISNIN